MSSFRMWTSTATRYAVRGGIIALPLLRVCSCEEKSFTAEEVSERNGANGRPFWVTYKGAVYDVTKFQAVHPGGNFINQAAGGPVEPFWAKWALHFESDAVQTALRENKIGTLIGDDETRDEDLKSAEYASDPYRDPKMHTTFSNTPYDSETRTEVLADPKNYFTPNEALYVRNHAPVPALDAETHFVSFLREVDDTDGGGTASLDRISLSGLLKRHRRHEVISVLQCAGNRQTDDFKATGDNGFTGGVYQNLRQGMVGNVRWRGVRLDEVLTDMYPLECVEEAVAQANGGGDVWHVVFTGADEYETSSPLSVMLDGKADCMLATHQNGQPLLRDHGYPVRALLPGIAGARNVKWLESIRLSRTPSTSPWMKHYYRRADGSNIQRLPLQSLVFTPDRSTVVKRQPGPNGKAIHMVNVSGVAYTGGNNASIESVEVTGDGGTTWVRAALVHETKEEKDRNAHPHAWVRYTAELPLDLTDRVPGEKVYIHSRARDSAGTVQPRVSPKQRGYLYSGWGKTSVRVD